jgi:uncharacterized protein (DUF433 family)
LAVGGYYCIETGMLTLDRHIVVTPDTLGGRPRIAGRRITVADIAVWHERMGLTTDRICDEYGLSLAEVHAALAYYFDHQGVIDQSLADDDAIVTAMRAKNPSLLQRKLKERTDG